MMESIEKLRKALKDCTSVSGVEPNQFDTYWITAAACDKYIDEIEREIAEHYMELPVDADGVPIRCGDVVDGGMGDSGKVQHVELWPDGFVVVYECHPGTFTRYAPDAVRHVKSRTIEDVLKEFGKAYTYVDGECASTATLIADYADELRSMGVGG